VPGWGAPPNGAGVTVLGRATGITAGFGPMAPTRIFLSGGPTGFLTTIAWNSWGSAQATGTGTAQYVLPGGIVAQDATIQSANGVAFDLGDRGGQLMYQEVMGYFPQFGGAFNPQQAVNVCNR
jgi:hypothetical protein